MTDREAHRDPAADDTPIGAEPRFIGLDRHARDFDQAQRLPKRQFLRASPQQLREEGIGTPRQRGADNDD